MSKKRMLADVLWEAANRHLSEISPPSWAGRKYEYSCEAVAEAAGVEWSKWQQFVRNHPAMTFVRGLGCKTGSDAQFRSFKEGPERQGVRYMWLLLAMHVAEDEGIEA